MRWHGKGKLSALALSAALAAGGATPVRAIILQAGADPEEDRQRAAAANAAGAKHAWVVRIMFGHDGGPCLQHGSGTYLGTSADGRYGYILTAAHLTDFVPGAGWKPAFAHVVAFMGPGDGFGRGLGINRILVHPDWQGTMKITGSTPAGSKSGDCERLEGGGGNKDLAILVFDAAGNAELVAAKGLSPAALVEPGELKDSSCLEGEVSADSEEGKEAFHVNLWEPVPPHLPWLRAVLAGEPVLAWELKPAAGAWQPPAAPGSGCPCAML